MAPHSSTLAWKIPWTEEPGRLQSMGSLRVGHDGATSLSLFTFMHWRREWQPTPVFLPGESQGPGSLVGCCLWGRTESDTTEVTQQQQQCFDKSQPTFDQPNLEHCTSRGKGVAKQTPFSELGLIPVYWSNVRCRGDEENILLCEKDIWQGRACSEKMAAAVLCSFSHGKKKKKLFSCFTFILFSAFQVKNVSQINVFLSV